MKTIKTVTIPGTTGTVESTVYLTCEELTLPECKELVSKKYEIKSWELLLKYSSQQLFDLPTNDELINELCETYSNHQRRCL